METFMEKNYENRCSTAKIKVTDSTGAPLKNTAVNFELKNHEFLFGCGAFDVLMSTIKEKPAFLQISDEEFEKHKAFTQDRVDKWTAVFNYGTLPFYWGQYEPVEGDVKWESRMAAATYLREHSAIPKGHPLCWHTVCADWLMKYDNKTIMDKQLARINRDVTRFKGVVDIWDVINETVIMPVFDKYDNAVTRICNQYGRLNLIKEVFAAAHAANPDALLLINDFNLSDEYRKVIDEALEAGVQIGAIGIQTHQHQGYKGINWLNDVLERFSVFGLPLHFTENTLISGEIMPAHIVDLNDYQVEEWPSTPEGEERQAREWTEMYERLFEHPLVEAVTGWDFADGAWLHAPSGLVRLDNSEKPAYFALKNMIHEKWHTNKTIVTDGEGYVTLSGYRGLYSVKAGDKTAELVLNKNAKELVCSLNTIV